MSDPNYAHEYDPNRQGKCKRIVGNEICHLGADADVHTRFKSPPPPKWHSQLYLSELGEFEDKIVLHVYCSECNQSFKFTMKKEA